MISANYDQPLAAEHRAFGLKRCESASISEKGIAILEATVAMLLLFILLATVLEVSRLLLASMMLDQAAREGVRTASRLPRLNANVVSAQDLDTTANIGDCELPNRGGKTVEDCADVLIHARTRHILRRHGSPAIDWTNNPPPIWDVNVNDVHIVSEFRDKTWAAAGDNSQNTVSVTLNGNYNGIFMSYPIGSSFRGPYLF